MFESVSLGKGKAGPLLHCQRCGHNWTTKPRVRRAGGIKKSRKKQPRLCPKCKSKLWNVPHLEYVGAVDGRGRWRVKRKVKKVKK